MCDSDTSARLTAGTPEAPAMFTIFTPVAAHMLASYCFTDTKLPGFLLALGSESISLINTTFPLSLLEFGTSSTAILRGPHSHLWFNPSLRAYDFHFLPVSSELRGK